MAGFLSEFYELKWPELPGGNTGNISIERKAARISGLLTRETAKEVISLCVLQNRLGYIYIQGRLQEPLCPLQCVRRLCIPKL